MENKNQNKWLMVVIIILLLVIIVLGCVIGYMILDKKDNNKANNQPEINNSNVETNNSDNESNENQLSLLGLFEGSINGLNASGYEMTAYFKLNIKEDNSCEFSRNVSGGSGWSATGNCIIEDSKIVLTSDSFQFDAEKSSESKKYTFIINTETSISYEDGLGKVTLIKQ